jgi:hypothetical protein
MLFISHVVKCMSHVVGHMFYVLELISHDVEYNFSACKINKFLSVLLIFSGFYIK